MKFLAEERSHYQRETKSLLLKKEAQDHSEEHKVGTTTRTMATRERQLWALARVSHQHHQTNVAT